MDDLRERIETHDESSFLDLLDQFPDQVQTAWEIGQRASVPDGEVREVLVCGVGGSGITGDLLASFLGPTCTVPILTHRNYGIPPWVSEQTLVIPVSYSGNTEETLSAYRAAREQDAICLPITSNGTVEKQALVEGDSVVNIPPDMPPRASAAYLLTPLVLCLGRMGLAEPLAEEDHREARDQLLELTDQFSPESSSNKALEIARRLYRRIPIVYGSEPLTSVLARRLKNQFHENAKMFATHGALPEINHNEIMSWSHLGEDPERYRLVFLRDAGESPPVQRRFAITRSQLEDQVGRIEVIQSRGSSRFCRMLTLMLYTDYVSYYAAVLRGKDPTAIGAIESFKTQLEENEQPG